jgi:hypothetical protein
MRSQAGILGLFTSLWATARLGVIMLGVLAITAVLGVLIMWPVIAINLTPARQIAFTPIEPGEKAARESRAETTLRSAGERLVNRSPFYPLKPQAPEPPRNLPRQYAGPRIVAIYGDTAWFDDKKRLRVGEPEQEGLQLIEVSPPWGAKVRWRGGEFTITLFERTADVLSSGGFSRENIVEPRTFLSPPRRPAPQPAPAPTPPPAPVAAPAEVPGAAPSPPSAPPPDGGPPIASEVSSPAKNAEPGSEPNSEPHAEPHLAKPAPKASARRARVPATKPAAALPASPSPRAPV